jgi:hypothetical protein
VAAGERSSKEEHHGPHHLVRERLPRPHRVRAQQVQLEALGIRGGDADAGELTDSRRDPVNGLTAANGVLDNRPSGANPLPSDRVEPRRRRPARHGLEPRERERFGDLHGKAPYPERPSLLVVNR